MEDKRSSSRSSSRSPARDDRRRRRRSNSRSRSRDRRRHDSRERSGRHRRHQRHRRHRRYHRSRSSSDNSSSSSDSDDDDRRRRHRRSKKHKKKRKKSDKKSPELSSATTNDAAAAATAEMIRRIQAGEEFIVPKSVHGNVTSSQHHAMILQLHERQKQAADATSILKLSSLVDPSTLTSSESRLELIDDITEVCTEMDVKVENVNVLKGDVYIKCASTSDASAARTGLQGRMFDEKEIQASFVSNKDYAALLF